jgi:Flp pilus assembly protein TadG
LIAAIFETGLMFFASQSLQTAVTEGTRAILIGDAQADASLRSSNVFASKYICPLLPSAMFTCSSLKVDVKVITNGYQNLGILFSTDIQSAGTQFCIGKKGDIVVVRALYPMPVFMKILALGIPGTMTVNVGTTWNPTTGDYDTRILMGTAVFRNEPFMTAVQTPC